jgi:hypothetical protein
MHSAATALIAILSNSAPFSATAADESGEWIRLDSSLPDEQLFRALKGAWARLGTPISADFALLFCRSEPDSGVWLHHLSTPALKADYWTGCHEIPNWNV